MGKYGIRKLIDELVEKYKTNDPIELCSHLDIDIIEVLNVDIIACTVKILDKTAILINKSVGMNETIRALAIGHEMCHGLYHESDDPLFIKQNMLLMSSRLEYEADFFAAYLFLHKKESQNEFIEDDDFIDSLEDCMSKLKKLREWNK